MPSAPMLLALSGFAFAGYVAALLGAAMAALGSTFPDVLAAGLVLALVSQLAHFSVDAAENAHVHHAAAFGLGVWISVLVLVGFALGGGRA